MTPVASFQVIAGGLRLRLGDALLRDRDRTRILLPTTAVCTAKIDENNEQVQQQVCITVDQVRSYVVILLILRRNLQAAAVIRTSDKQRSVRSSISTTGVVRSLQQYPAVI